MSMCIICLCFRVRQSKIDKASVLDIDGTYLERKRQKLLSSNVRVASLPRPAFPLTGWQTVDEKSSEEVTKEMPIITQSTMYTYLAEGVGNAKGSLSFRSLKRGYIHWASGRVKKIEIQTRNPNYAFVRCTMIPSMRSGTYTVKVMLKKQSVLDSVIGKIEKASCDCAAG